MGRRPAENDEIDVGEFGKCALATTKAPSMWCLREAAKGPNRPAAGDPRQGGNTFSGARSHEGNRPGKSTAYGGVKAERDHDVSRTGGGTAVPWSVSIMIIRPW